MDFLEVVAATALGATAPVVLSRYLDRRAVRRERQALSETGLGRYLDHVLTGMDKNARDLADQLHERQ